MSTKSGKECVFPFTYSDEEHEECTTAAGYDDWCATAVDKYGKMKEWDYCHVPCGKH